MVSPAHRETVHTGVWTAVWVGSCCFSTAPLPYLRWLWGSCLPSPWSAWRGNWVVDLADWGPCHQVAPGRWWGDLLPHPWLRRKEAKGPRSEPETKRWDGQLLSKNIHSDCIVGVNRPLSAFKLGNEPTWTIRHVLKKHEFLSASISLKKGSRVSASPSPTLLTYVA